MTIPEPGNRQAKQIGRERYGPPDVLKESLDAGAGALRGKGSTGSGKDAGERPRRPGRVLLVKDVMMAPVLTVRSAATAHEALETMKLRRIQHLVIVNADGCVEGVLSDRDLRSAQPSLVLVPDRHTREKALSLIRVADVMTPHPLTAKPTEPVVSVLERMLAAKVGSIPVLDDYGRPIGILTGFDVVRLAIRLLGGDDEA
jgi:CBS domain-containing protein